MNNTNQQNKHTNINNTGTTQNKTKTIVCISVVDFTGNLNGQESKSTVICFHLFTNIECKHSSNIQRTKII